jgi:hypothetical protein
MLARYYSSSLGRFMAVDPSRASVRPAQPQTWNRYSYVFNNPLRLVDPDGMLAVDAQTAKIYPKAAAFILSLKPVFKDYNAYRKIGGINALKLDVDKAFVPGSGRR